ncbi:MAG: UDP-N-acetylmuramoyl-L-alanyl-D-glutamate--2,6-diaminopimelate ligase [Ilumatobacteraceae bacterium]
MVRSLAELIASSGLPESALHGDAQQLLSSIEFDSRRVQPGSLFCCVRGDHVDGHDYAARAIDRGAVALLVDHPLDTAVAQVVVDDTRQTMGLLAAAFYGHPSTALTMVGVTGTNGKTTTVSLIAAVLRHAGLDCGVIGTLTGVHTTPEAPELQRLLAEFLDQGKRAVVMEVSSHALALHRVQGCHFDVAVFTNLGRDHLDLHTTMERYFAAKAALFKPEFSDLGVANADDAHGRRLISSAPIPMVGFSLAEVRGLHVGVTAHSYEWNGQRVEVGIGGHFNASNSLAAATACTALGFSPAEVAAGLRAAPAVPGRFEPVLAGQAFDVLVDFAHTPEGLREALLAARPPAAAVRDYDAAVIVVFGCGGDRDRTKRPEMGAVAAELADWIVITSDNPRSEDPVEIINAIVRGVPADYRGRVVIEQDRRLAIAAAFHRARPGDVVVIAGKGHEATQTIGLDVHDFDDRIVARELLRAAQ